MVLEEGIPRSVIDAEAAQHEPPPCQSYFARTAALPLLETKQGITMDDTGTNVTDLRNDVHIKGR